MKKAIIHIFIFIPIMFLSMICWFLIGIFSKQKLANILIETGKNIKQK